MEFSIIKWNTMKYICSKMYIRFIQATSYSMIQFIFATPWYHFPLYLFFFDTHIGGWWLFILWHKMYYKRRSEIGDLCQKNERIYESSAIIIIIMMICFSSFCSAFYIAIYFPKVGSHPFVISVGTLHIDKRDAIKWI